MTQCHHGSCKAHALRVPEIWILLRSMANAQYFVRSESQHSFESRPLLQVLTRIGSKNLSDVDPHIVDFVV